MDMNEKRFEQERLETVKKRLLARLEAVEKQLTGRKKDVLSARREMGKEAPMAIRSFDDVITLAGYGSAVKSVEDSYLKLSKEREFLRKLVNSAYFARIDFAEDGGVPEKIYIGIGSFYDKDTFEFYVYDWRSPIASMFYEFDAGEAWYECAEGIIRGELQLKRQFRVYDGKMEYMYDSDAAVNDEILGKMLEANVEAKLKVIINSIQREQNAVIRSSGSKNLLVFGAAGSGKTSVGLHRLAYLLFQQNQLLLAKNILIISNNYVFNAYIAQILPELGEADVPRAVFNDIVSDFVPLNFKMYDFYEQAEYFLQNPGRNARRLAVQLKYSREFLAYMEQFLGEFQFKPGDITYDGEVICSGAELAHDLNVVNQHLSFKSKVARMLVYAEGKINDYFIMNEEVIRAGIKQKRVEIWKSTDIETQMPNYKDVWEQTRAQAKGQLTKSCGVSALKLYKQILTSYVRKDEFLADGLGDEIYRYTAENINAGHLFFEDWLVLLCVKCMIGEIPAASHIKHVLVDEAQDYAILQHYILKNMFNQAKFTLLGDLNQGILPVLGMSGEGAFMELYGEQNTAIMWLTKSYRSTKQINQLAAKFIDSDTSYFNREGCEPTLIIAEGFAEAIVELVMNKLPQSTNLTCILTKTAAQADMLYGQLKTQLNLNIIDNTEESLEKGLCIAPAVLCKGLEFDAVIIADFEPCDDRLHYLLCTRALHSLFIIAPKQRELFWRNKLGGN